MSIRTNQSAASAPLTELRDQLSDFAARCRSAMWFGALFRVCVLADVVEDVLRLFGWAKTSAYKAEQLDLEAVKALDSGDIKRARRLILRSARVDHDLAEVRT